MGWEWSGGWLRGRWEEERRGGVYTYAFVTATVTATDVDYLLGLLCFVLLLASLRGLLLLRLYISLVGRTNKPATPAIGFEDSRMLGLYEFY